MRPIPKHISGIPGQPKLTTWLNDLRDYVRSLTPRSFDNGEIDWTANGVNFRGSKGGGAASAPQSNLLQMLYVQSEVGGNGAYVGNTLICSTIQGTGFSATYSIIGSGSVNSVTIITSGSGYFSNFGVEFPPGNATGTAIVTGGKVTSVTINPGGNSGYLSGGSVALVTAATLYTVMKPIEFQQAFWATAYTASAPHAMIDGLHYYGPADATGVSYSKNQRTDFLVDSYGNQTNSQIQVIDPPYSLGLPIFAIDPATIDGFTSSPYYLPPLKTNLLNPPIFTLKTLLDLNIGTVRRWKSILPFCGTGNSQAFDAGYSFGYIQPTQAQEDETLE
jgi:hypothetical protein